MFAGHFGAGFGAKAAAPKVSLGTLFFAAQFVDLLWPTLLLLGLEHASINAAGTHPPLSFTDYPISHSLLTVVGWGAVFGLAHFALRRDRRAALVLGLTVLSHWLLDLIVHVPDLPLAPGSVARFGLGLWRHPLVAASLELALFTIGVLLYLRVTRPRDTRGKWILGALVLFLLAIQVSNSVGGPPPSMRVVAWVGQAQWLFVAWGTWADHHRHAMKSN